MALSLEIVTPRGVAFEEDDLERVVLRREEDRFDLGSEVVILPRHGELLVRLPFHALRALGLREEITIEVDGGFAEVYHDRITILTRDARPVSRMQIPCGPA